MKGEIDPDHMPVNKYNLSVLGLIELTALEISGIEEELETVELPDKTVASGGIKKATEFTMMMPLHHTIEQIAMEAWFQESTDPVTPTYKKPCTLEHLALSGTNRRSFTLIGVFPKKRKLPDLEKANEGEIAMVEWTMSVDSIIPI